MSGESTRLYSIQYEMRAKDKLYSEMCIGNKHREKNMYLHVFLNGMPLDEAVIVLISWYIAHADIGQFMNPSHIH